MCNLMLLVWNILNLKKDEIITSVFEVIFKINNVLELNRKNSITFYYCYCNIL
jgi:hypothetical protein